MNIIYNRFELYWCDFGEIATNVNGVFDWLLTAILTRNNFINVEKNGNVSTRKRGVVSAASIQLIAIDSNKAMTRGDIDIVADSIADFLLQNYLRGNRLLRS